MTFVGTRDASIDEDEAVPKLTTEVELRIDEDVVATKVDVRMDEDGAVPRLTTEVELRMNEDEDVAVLKLTTDVELKIDVVLKFRSAA